MENSHIPVQSTKSPHFWWIISLLILIIICLVATVICGQMQDTTIIVDYVSFASVLLSITLSVFAIQYTYTSNNQIQHQFEKINSAAGQINSVSEKLIKTSTLLEENIDDILNKLGDIGKEQKAIKDKVDNMNQRLPEMDQLNNIRNDKTEW